MFSSFLVWLLYSFLLLAQRERKIYKALILSFRMKIEEIAKRIYLIRAAIDYSAKEQFEAGVPYEIKLIKDMIKDLKMKLN